MIDIPMKSDGPLSNETINNINNKKNHEAYCSDTILNLNNSANTQSEPNTTINAPNAIDSIQNNQQERKNVNQIATPKDIRSLPNLQKLAQKGQKLSLETNGKPTILQSCLGWNTSNDLCDVDVSAFMLDTTGKVIADDWFVFYGQPQSPDNSTIFSQGNSIDREIITIDLQKLNPSVQKIVFVLTINEAIENNLNFSMLKDAYIRILDSNQEELVSFMLDEYYSNVTSMMIGEIYNHNSQWKFNAIGNGVAKDLAGLCEFYGVQVQ